MTWAAFWIRFGSAVLTALVVSALIIGYLEWRDSRRGD